LVADLKKRKATIVTVSGKTGKQPGSNLNLAVPAFSNLPAMGIPFASACQALALFKALAKKLNPDVPSGLDPWIILKEKR
jgi:glutamine---fructose-6-phosphate transaminase (isomerizing)